MENEILKLFKIESNSSEVLNTEINKNMFDGGGKKVLIEENITNKIEYIYRKNKYIFYETTSDNNIYIIEMYQNDDIEQQLCINIIIDKSSRSANIENISKFKNCIKLEKENKGSYILNLAIKFIKTNKKKYNTSKITLKDNSYLFCDNNHQKIPLSIITTLSRGTTWYMRHDFIPLNSNKDNLTTEDLYKKALKNKYIVKNILLKDTQFYMYLYSSILENICNKNQNNIQKCIEQTEEKVKYYFEKYNVIYNDKPIIYFFKNELENFHEHCGNLSNFYKKYSESIGLYNFHQVTFYQTI